MRKLSPLASLTLGARLPSGIMTSSISLMLQNLQGQVFGVGGGESFCNPVLPVSNPVVSLPCPRVQCWEAHWRHLASSVSFIRKSDSSQLSTLFPVFRLAHNLVGRGMWFTESPKRSQSLTVLCILTPQILLWIFLCFFSHEITFNPTCYFSNNILCIFHRFVHTNECSLFSKCYFLKDCYWAVYETSE